MLMARYLLSFIGCYRLVSYCLVTLLPFSNVSQKWEYCKSLCDNDLQDALRAGTEVAYSLMDELRGILG